jgi:hypothetical protein
MTFARISKKEAEKKTKTASSIDLNFSDPQITAASENR